MGIARNLPLLFGLFGATNLVLGARLWWLVLHSPGDDNLVGALGCFVALIALVPTYGLALARRGVVLRAHRAWLACALGASAVLAVLFPIILMLS